MKHAMRECRRGKIRRSRRHCDDKALGAGRAEFGNEASIA